MSEAQNVSVKAYITYANGTEEVRRFGVPEETSTNYSYLKERIRTIFSLGSDNFKLHWQDSENDYVLISSDEELFEAITECITRQEQTLLRVYVTVTGTANKPQTPKNDNTEKNKSTGSDKPSRGHVPVRVICDGCDERVIGVRFKCRTCHDFDLCESCEAKGIHKHHPFQKIPKEFAGFGFTLNAHAEGLPEDFCGMPGWRKWGRGGRGGRGFRRWAHHHQQQQQQQQQQQGQQQQGQQQQQQQQQNQNQQEQTFSGGMPNFSQSDTNSRNERADPKPFQFSFSNSASGGSGCPFVSVGTGVFPTPGGMNFTIPEMNFSSPDMPFPDPQKIAEEAGRFASQMASKQVADIMKGIWTAWSGNQERSSNGQQCYNGPEFDTNRTQSGNKETSDQGADKCNCNSGVIDIELDDNICPTPKGNQETESSAEKINDEMDNGSPDVVVMETDESGRSSGKSTPIHGDDWTLLNKESSPDGATKSTTAPPSQEKEKGTQSAYPIIPVEDSSLPPHPNERVRSALEQMRGMGYSDEGGWLTKLLEMKDGDINKVLDILLVQRK